MTAKKGTEIPKKTAAAVSAKTENVTAPAKESAVKEEAVKVEKAPAKKTAEPRKAAAKAAPKTTKTTKAEKEAASQNVYIQFAGKEVKTEELVEQVKALWTAQGHRVSSIKSLEVYVKPEDNAAYYVINGKENGKVDL